MMLPVEVGVLNPLIYDKSKAGDNLIKYHFIKDGGWTPLFHFKGSRNSNYIYFARRGLVFDEAKLQILS